MKLLIIFFLVLLFSSCKESNVDFAIKWSADIKSKILNDVKAYDSVSIDSSLKTVNTLMFYNHRIKTKKIRIRAESGDTLFSIFYSKDQQFEFLKEYCIVDGRSVEGIRYKGMNVGLIEFRFCDGQLKKQGFRYRDDVGIWKKWDNTGKMVEEKDLGNYDSLLKLKEIKYAY